MIIAKYKYDKSIYENVIPRFNNDYTGYTISDEIDSVNSNHVIRTIECDTLPTQMIFGNMTESSTQNGADSILEILYADVQNLTTIEGFIRLCANITKANIVNFTSNITRMYVMCQHCYNLTQINVNDWDVSNVTDMSYAFGNCQKLTSLDVSNWDTSNVTTMHNMFSNCNKLTSLDVSNFDTSNVTDMSGMFHSCSSLTSLDVSNFNTSNVTNMGSMFNGCISLTSLDLSNWDTSKVTNMGSMFAGCISLTSLDLSNWDTSKVTNMGYMFHHCEKLIKLDISNWDTSNVTSMYAMFWNCIRLTSLDVSGFDTSNVTNMGSFIGELRNAKILNLNNIHATDNKTIIDGDDRFLINTVAEKIYLNDLDTLNTVMRFLPDRTGKEPGKLVTSLRNKIPEETLVALTAKNWEIVDIVAQYRFDANRYENLLPEFNAEFTADKYRVIDDVHELVLDDMIWYDGILNEYGDVGYNDIYPRAVHSNYFRVTPNIMYNVDFATVFNNNKIVNIQWYDINKNLIEALSDVSSSIAPSNAVYVRFCTDAQDWDDQGLDLKDCRVSAKLVNRTIESVNGDLPTLMRFGRTYVDGESATNNRTDSLLEVLDINTSGLTSCSNMFRYCKNLTSITCEWNTSNVTNMGNMFSTCYDLTSLDVSNFNTSNVTSMYSMFNGCISLTSLDLSNWDTSDVNDMAHMFRGCTKLTSLDVSNFSTSNVINISHMFSNCQSLTSLDVSNFDTENVTNMESMFFECYNLISLDVSNWNTSNVTNMNGMFYKCYELESLNLKKWNTSNVTAIDDFISGFGGTSRLTVIDISNFDLGKVTNIVCHMINNVPNLKYIVCNNVDTMNKQNVLTSIPTRTVENPGFIICNADTTNLDVTTLNSKNWRLATAEDMVTVTQYKFDKSIYEDFMPEFNGGANYPVFVRDEVNGNIVTRTLEIAKGMELPWKMRFSKGNYNGSGYDGTELALLEVSCINNTNLITERQMFQRCSNLIKIEGFTSNIMHDLTHMFTDCYSLISLDLNNWDISRVTTMLYMFYNCNSLTSLNISNWNTSNVVRMDYMFKNCSKLTSLDVSNFDTSKVTNMAYMFYDCNNLQEVKLGENFKISSACNVTDFVTNCNANFIVADDVATYYIDEPLRKGDKIINSSAQKVDIERKMAQVTLDGSEVWSLNFEWQTDTKIPFFCMSFPRLPYSSIINDKFSPANPYGDIRWEKECVGFADNTNAIYVIVDKSKLKSLDVEGFKQWLSENPITIVYELAEPTTQQLSPNEALLTCGDNSTISIDSNVPVQSYQPSKQYVEYNLFIQPNTEYLVKFKSDTEGTIDITLGGNKLANIQIVKGWNNVKIVTLATLTDNNLYIKGKNMNLSDIVVTPYDELFAQQGEYFEGLSSVGQMKRTKNLFDGQLPYIGGLKSNGTTNDETHKHTSNYIEVKPNTKYYWKNHDNISIYRVIGYDKQKQFVEIINDSSSIVEFGFTTSDNVYYIRIGQNTSDITTKAQLEEGTIATPYEPYGYKMDISVKGKNMYDETMIHNVSDAISSFKIEGNTIIVTCIKEKNWAQVRQNLSTLKPNTQYTISIGEYYHSRNNGEVRIYDYTTEKSLVSITKSNTKVTFTTPSDTERLYLIIYADRNNVGKAGDYIIVSDIEISENNITKTIYLQEPLRKGDKIEQVVENGIPVVRIIRNMTEITLDGSENWSIYNTSDNTIKFLSITAYPKCKVESSKMICDKLKYNRGSYDLERIRFRTPSWNTIFLWINKSRLSTHDVDGLKQWLSQNPVTAVYELETPIVNTISLDNLNFDVTANNTLSIDSNVPVQKITFNNLVEKDYPLLASTNYMLQFKADNSGKIWIGLGTNNLKEFDCVKGLNSYIVTTPTTLENNNLTIKGKAIKINDVIVTQSNEIFEVDYYKGVESTFENPYDDGGTTKYKATIKLTGKNKWSFGDIIDKDVVKFENIHIPKGIYKLSGDAPKIYESAPAMRFEYKDGSYERATISSNHTLNFKDDIVRIVFYSNGYNYANSIDKLASATNIQLEEGNVVTPYEPYFEDIKEIDLTTPLFAGDELIAYDDGIYHKHTKGKIVLNGSRKWIIGTTPFGWTEFEDSLIFYLPTKEVKNVIKSTSLFISNKIAYKSNLVNINEEGLTNQPWNEDVNEDGVKEYVGHIAIRILKSRLITLDVQGFEQWLSENPIEVVYELAEPYEEKVSDNFLYFTVVPKSTITADTRVPFYTMTASYKPDEVESISTIAEIEENIDVTTMIVDDEIIPYIMDMDLLLTEMEMKSDISTVSTFSLITIMDEMGGEDMASMQERTQRMLERIIRCGQYDVQELKDRVILYEDAKRITSEQALELMMLINEIYGA